MKYHTTIKKVSTSRNKYIPKGMKLPSIGSVLRDKSKLLNAGLVCMFIVGIFILSFPFLPRLKYYLFDKGKEVYPYETNLLIDSAEASEEDERDEIPKDNRLVIPALSVDMPIVEGEDESVLDRGVWRRPRTGIPGEENMVISGHRWGLGLSPKLTSFYNLDKLKKQDNIIIYWQGKEYDYEITGSEVVSKNAMHIENQDVGERLTLYTCHPLGSNDSRLVYYARPIEVPDKPL